MTDSARPFHPGTEILVPEVDMRGRKVPMPGTPEYESWFPQPQRPLSEEHEAKRLRCLANGTKYRISKNNTVYTGARFDSEKSAEWERPVPPSVIPPRECDQPGCGNHAIVGHRMCRSHGGQLPTVRQAAQRRITNLAENAISTLEDLLDPVHSDHVRRQAASDLLDRAGFKSPDVTLELTQSNDANPRLDAAIQAALASRFPDMQLPDPDDTHGMEVIDADSYEDEDPQDSSGDDLP